MSIWNKIKSSSIQLKKFFTHRQKIDIQTMEELEELLLEADFGYHTVDNLQQFLKKERFEKEIDLRNCS